MGSFQYSLGAEVLGELAEVAAAHLFLINVDDVLGGPELLLIFLVVSTALDGGSAADEFSHELE